MPSWGYDVGFEVPYGARAPQTRSTYKSYSVPTTYSPLLVLPSFFILPSTPLFPFLQSLGRSNPLSPGFLCNNGLLLRTLTQKPQSQRRVLPRIPKQSHPDFRKPCQEMFSSPNPLVCVLTCPREKRKGCYKGCRMRVTETAHPQEVPFTLTVLDSLCGR